MDKKISPYVADQVATVTFEIIKDGSKFLFVMPQVCNLQNAYDSLREITADLVIVSEEVVAREKKQKEDVAAKEKDSKEPKVEGKKEEVTK